MEIMEGGVDRGVLREKYKVARICKYAGTEKTAQREDTSMRDPIA